jgi:hypothetical protein
MPLERLSGLVELDIMHAVEQKNGLVEDPGDDENRFCISAASLTPF